MVVAMTSGCATKHQRARQEVRTGYNLWVQNRFDEAATAYQRAIALNPHDAHAGRLLARVYEDAGSPDRALAVFRQLLRDQPDNRRVVTDFLWFCADHAWWPYGDDETVVLQEGVLAGEGAAQRWPNDPELLEALGWLGYKGGQTERPKMLYQKAVAIEKTPQRLYGLSIVSSKMGHRNQAVAAYQEAVALQQQTGPESIYEKGFRQVAETMLHGTPPQE
ncbi:MAG: tetratricopeptide repeat protein [Candidatus Omnitrophica bacterium]|nr:tetratricopeptide repeat protein [Candidatus Omnitrophota bacterium]